MPERRRELERELRSLRDAAAALLAELARVAAIDDDAEAGRALKRLLRPRGRAPLQLVPRPKR